MIADFCENILLFFVKTALCAMIWLKVAVNLHRISDYMQFFKISCNFFCNPVYLLIDGVDSLILKQHWMIK